MPSLSSDAIVWKHFVQIESNDASGFRLWANGTTVIIVKRSWKSAAFEMEGKLYFGRRVMPRLKLRLSARLSRIAHFFGEICTSSSLGVMGSA